MLVHESTFLCYKNNQFYISPGVIIRHNNATVATSNTFESLEIVQAPAELLSYLNRNIYRFFITRASR